MGPERARLAGEAAGTVAAVKVVVTETKTPGLWGRALQGPRRRQDPPAARVEPQVVEAWLEREAMVLEPLPVLVRLETARTRA